jgi:H+/Cl- antiporter ClcA
MQLHEVRTIARTGYIRLLLWIVALSIPVGVLTVAYLWVYHEGSHIYHEVSASLGVPTWLFTILVATLGGLLVGVGLRFLGGHRKEDETLDRQIAEGRVPHRGLVWLLLTSLIGLISGASVGPEGPLAHAAAGMGTWLAEKRKYSAEESRLLSLGSVSAVFGAFLGTPLSAAFMTLEFTRQLAVPIYANMIVTTVAALFGALIMFAITHAPPTGASSYPIEGAFTVPDIGWAVALGLVGLAWAFLFKLIFETAQRVTAPLDRYPLLKPTLGGFFFGLVGAWMPLTLFSGQYEMAEVLETGEQLGVWVLLLLAVLKLITLSVSLSTGFPGGYVFPVFFSASALGYAIHLMFPIIPLPVSIVGTLAGVGGGVMRMPFAVILLLTVISNPGLLPVSVIASLTSFMTATMLAAGSAREALDEAQADMREIYGEEAEAEDKGQKEKESQESERG